LPRNDVALVAPDMPRLAERSLLTQPAPTVDANLFSPNMSELSAQLLPAVQRGCDLAQRGALYAAQTEFIQVMRRIAQANDAERRTDEHSLALAEGLRALDEAADFMPQGAALEGEIDVKIIASSHRTPLVRQFPRYVPPHSAIALYHAFAQERLAAAMGGHQAGSMALFALGRVHARLAERNDDDVLATRSAMTMYLAALSVSPENHLAANELAVLLCRNGHPAEAARLFEQAIDHAPAATTYHNLAVAQQKLGLAGQAAANEQESQRLAAWERATGAVSRRAGIQWVSPQELAQVTPPAGMPTAQNAPAPIPYAAAPIPPKSPLQKAASFTKSLPIPGTRTAEKTPAAPAPRGPSPAPTATTRNIPWF
jgi:tetratricopeptide (TPR) repeat protein